MNPHYRQTSLFDESNLIQRPLPEQREFEIDYYDVLKSIPEIFSKGFLISNEVKKKKNPLSMNRNWFANEMSGNVIDLVSQSFPLFIKYTGRGSYCLFLNYKYECYIKKLTNKKLFPMYNHSLTSKRLTDQKALKIEEPIPIIYIGWTINNSNDNITGYYAVCIKGNERIWCSDLTCINPPNILDVDVDNNTPNPVGVIVTPKTHRKSKNN